MLGVLELKVCPAVWLHCLQNSQQCLLHHWEDGGVESRSVSTLSYDLVCEIHYWKLNNDPCIFNFSRSHILCVWVCVVGGDVLADMSISSVSWLFFLCPLCASMEVKLSKLMNALEGCIDFLDLFFFFFFPCQVAAAVGAQSHRSVQFVNKRLASTSSLILRHYPFRSRSLTVGS